MNNEERKKGYETNRMSYKNLNEQEKDTAFEIVKKQIIKECTENNGDTDAILDDMALYYAEGCVYFYENGILTYEY